MLETKAIWNSHRYNKRRLKELMNNKLCMSSMCCVVELIPVKSQKRLNPVNFVWFHKIRVRRASFQFHTLRTYPHINKLCNKQGSLRVDNWLKHFSHLFPLILGWHIAQRHCAECHMNFPPICTLNSFCRFNQSWLYARYSFFFEFCACGVVAFHAIVFYHSYLTGE